MFKTVQLLAEQKLALGENTTWLTKSDFPTLILTKIRFLEEQPWQRTGPT